MKTGVVGASGYAGGELLRLLAGHPIFEPRYFAAGGSAGELVTSIHSHLTRFEDERFSAVDIESIDSLDLVFLALPHGQSASLVEQLRPDLKIVDLGADFRLGSADSWKKYYGGEHAGRWTYGLPEIAGQRALIKSSARVANPGCYATAAALGIAPIVKSAAAQPSEITIVAASGTTGAGRSTKVSLSASEIMNSLTSYKFGGIHQHTPEIEQTLTEISAREVKVSFTPILAPMPRGILATISLNYSGDFEEALRSYQDAYAAETFVRLLPEGRLPETSSLIGSNFAHIQIALDQHVSRLLISVAIDNLGKGAAGQAIQNANLITGLDETLGLTGMGVGQ